MVRLVCARTTTRTTMQLSSLVRTGTTSKWFATNPRPFCSEKRSDMFAIKAEVSDPGAEAFAFSDQKTMYGGKHIASGDMIFVFASENERGPGLIASGLVTSAEAS